LDDGGHVVGFGKGGRLRWTSGRRDDQDEGICGGEAEGRRHGRGRLEAYRKMVDAILEQHGRGKDISASIDSQIPGTRDWVLGRDPVATADSILDALGGVFTTGS
jgi:hypothetical protein